MPQISVSVPFPIPCPKCAHRAERSIADLKTEPIVICEACGQRFSVQGDGAVADVVTNPEELDRLLDDNEPGPTE